MLEELLMGLFLLVLGIIFGYEITKEVKESAEKKGYLGKDMHKWKKPKVAEFGGLGFVIGFISSVVVAFSVIVFFGLYEWFDLAKILLLVASVVSIGGIVGVMSDLFKFRWRTNAIIPAVSATPLLWMATDPRWSYIHIPIIGNVQLGAWYTLALLLGATGASNAINMIAGYNGIEASMTIIILSSLGVMLGISGNIPLLMADILLIAVLIGFLIWNKYPAKIFPGDVGTWSFGSAIFAISVLGKLEFWAVLLFPLYFIHLILVIKHRKELRRYKEKFAKPKKDGTLTAKTDGAIYFWLVRRFKMRENDVTKTILSMQLIISAVVVLGYYLIR